MALLKTGPTAKNSDRNIRILTVKQIAKIVETHKVKEIKNSPQHKLG